MAIGRLTTHAKQRMRKRRVSEREVDEVLMKPDSAQYDPDEDSFRLERKLSQGTLKPRSTDGVGGVS
ncbi:DUF4258 domain-containing protein [Luteococcus sp. Sow4_B9]|uniref:DUF4258 domain-containing protein n=1 Tax=Luteococcus sp. Sow4_B9 TaxID=3438792 RepID=UPI003F949A57